MIRNLNQTNFFLKGSKPATCEMTIRTKFIDNRNIVHFFIVLFLGISISMCIGGADALENPTDPSKNLEGSPTTSPPIGKSSNEEAHLYTISIDPIGLQKAGDPIIITGTIDMPGNPVIWVEVVCIHAHTVKGMILPCNMTSGEAITMQKQIDGVQKWYFLINTTELSPDHYIIEAGKAARYAGDIAAYDIGNFYLLPAETATTIEELPIRIDPVPYHASNDTIRLQGTISNYSGETLTLTVSPGQFLPGGTWQPRSGTGSVNGLIAILPESKGKTPWVFTLDTTTLDQGDYSIEIRSADGNLKGYGLFSLQKTSIQYSVPITLSQQELARQTFCSTTDNETSEGTPIGIYPTSEKPVPLMPFVVLISLGIIVIRIAMRKDGK
ncbi:MAG TPA: hypothetical protein P5214_08780 [Rectinema sp.]|nr:hypothetical protein [Rectinema sp.]